jgi:hypothetical protein
MNMTSINSSTSHFQGYQAVFQNSAANNATDKSDKASTSKSIAGTAKSLNVEKTTKYDLENITPQETYELASKLYDEGTIGFFDFVGMMAVGLSNQYPGPYTGPENPNNAPYNLLNELETIASGTHKSFTNTKQSDRNDIKDLLDILYSLHEEKKDTHIASIDIKV